MQSIFDIIIRLLQRFENRKYEREKEMSFLIYGCGLLVGNCTQNTYKHRAVNATERKNRKREKNGIAISSSVQWPCKQSSCLS